MCPMKWTTTLDFLELFPEKKIKDYDAVILYTGIVEWSPRPLLSAINDLYDNKVSANLDNLAINTRDYSKKIVNQKKATFDKTFGISQMESHFSRPFDTVYQGEKTINMYDLSMAEASLLPILRKIDNLIFISANRIVAGWNGDYARRRPENIAIIEKYSNLFCDGLKDTARVIDLSVWDESDVKRMTCDNIHLTKMGSDYIYEKIMGALGLDEAGGDGVVSYEGLLKSFAPMDPIERVIGKKKDIIRNRVDGREKVAALIIGVRLNGDDEERIRNLAYLLEWIDYYYEDLFDVLLVEQDAETKLDLKQLGAKDYVRHVFIYNPMEYNRGWGYNVAMKHHCPDTEVVALMDTDVLTGSNFLREILDCYQKYDVISPYQNIYYSDKNEREVIFKTNRIDVLQDSAKIKNPVTIAGGILIIKKSVYLALKGYEQYVGYACEDRAFDVTILNHVPREKLRIAPVAYVHLHHETDKAARVSFNSIHDHLQKNYGCKYTPGLGSYDFIHSKCRHASRERTLRLMIARERSFGDPDIYRDPTRLSINGQLPDDRGEVVSPNEVIFPPDYSSLSLYKEKEIYDGAPNPDVEGLSAFYNAYKGKRCFIIGNGPSLNDHDLSLLTGEFTFGVNSFYYKTRETGFLPTFYVVEDSSVMKENIDEIRKFDAPFKFFPTNYDKMHPKQPNTFFFKMNRGFYERSSPNYVVPRFSTDATKELYCGQSVTYINLQLAYFMGFTEVYLIGMDFSYVIPSTHKRTGDVLLSDTDDENHFHKDYFGKGKTWKDPKLDRVALNYRMAKLVFEATGRRVYNATVGGSLEVFERRSYYSLFGVDGHKSKVGSFKQANDLWRESRFAEALEVYVGLSKENPEIKLYRTSAADAYVRAIVNGQICSPSDSAFVRGLYFNI